MCFYSSSGRSLNGAVEFGRFVVCGLGIWFMVFLLG